MILTLVAQHVDSTMESFLSCRWEGVSKHGWWEGPWERLWNSGHPTEAEMRYVWRRRMGL